MSKNIIKATGIILAVNLIVKLLGFVREAFIAGGFGASGYTDAYLVAYTIPYFLQAILGYALVTAVVPILTKYWVDDDREQAYHVGSSLINLTAISMAILSVLGIFCAPALVAVTAPNLPAPVAANAIVMTKIMFPAVFFMGVGMVLTGVLNSRYSFAVAAFAPGASNIIIILAVIFFASTGIFSLAWGTLISFAAFFIIQIFPLRRTGFRYRFILDLKHPAVKGVMLDIWPIILGVAVNQIYLLLNRVFASGMGEGSISALNYAGKLMNLPIGIFVAAVATAVYPLLAEKALQKDTRGLGETMNRGLGLVGLVALPSAVGLIVLREPIVQLLFQHGQFDAFDTQITAYALLFMTFGLFFAAVNMILTRAYYATGDVKMPVVIGLVSIGVNVAASLAFMSTLQHGGLALANSLALASNTILLYYFLRKRLPSMGTRSDVISMVKMVIASITMGVVLYGVLFVFRASGPSGAFGLLMEVCVAMLAGVVTYLVVAKVLGVKEINEVVNLLAKKLKKQPKMIDSEQTR